MKTKLTLLFLAITFALMGQEKTITERVLLYKNIKIYEEFLKSKNPNKYNSIKASFNGTFKDYFSAEASKQIDVIIVNYEIAKSFKESIYSAAKLEYNNMNQMDRIGFQDYFPKGEESATDQTTLSVFGTEWQSAVIMGLTDFLLDRAKDEFTYAFIDDIKDMFTINEEKDSVVVKQQKKFLQITFSNFYSIIEKTDQFTYKNYVPAIRAAIIEDYNNLPYSLVRSGIALDSHINKNTKAVLNISFDRMEEIIKGDNPFLSLSKMSKSDNLLPIVNKNIKVGLQIIGILASEQYYIMNTETMIGSINIEVLQDLLKDKELRTIFLKILDKELAKKITISGNLHKELAIVEVSKCFDNINKIANDINSSKTDSVYSQKIVNYLNSITSAFVAVNTIFDNTQTEWGKFIGVMDTLVSIQKSVIRKNYNQSIILTTSLIKPELINSKVFRVMTLTANLAEVKNKEGVEVALKTFADPVGSFRAKRIKANKNRWSVTLNSYLGYSIGNEWLINANKEINNESSAYQSVYLPIGFEIDWATNWNPISTIGLFASPIDLGALASYRLNDQEWDSLSVSNANEISFRTVLAPSVTLVFGISKNKPITLSVGYQYAPEQRILKDKVLNVEDKLSVHHIFINLALDLTLLKF